MEPHLKISGVKKSKLWRESETKMNHDLSFIICEEPQERLFWELGSYTQLLPCTRPSFLEQPCSQSSPYTTYPCQQKMCLKA
jgi:hypothetical protein